jgi:hypothetical protein
MKLTNPAVAHVLKRLHYPLDVILIGVRWYAAYGLSLRNLEEMMAERGIEVDPSTCIAGHHVAAGSGEGVSPSQTPAGQKLAC